MHTQQHVLICPTEVNDPSYCCLDVQSGTAEAAVNVVMVMVNLIIFGRLTSKIHSKTEQGCSHTQCHNTFYFCSLRLTVFQVVSHNDFFFFVILYLLSSVRILCKLSILFMSLLGRVT